MDNILKQKDKIGNDIFDEVISNIEEHRNKYVIVLVLMKIF